MRDNNVLEGQFGRLALENLIYKEAGIMLQLKAITDNTNQNNLLTQLEQIVTKRN
jgi:hypothetical protein